jgi:DNA repair exonuclease SbcCD ATPase subunit
MSPGDKRNIIDRLFGFTIINQMKDSIRSERKELRDLIKTINDELGIIEESIVSINEKIVNLEEAKKEDKSKIVQEYKQKIIELLAERKQLVDDVTKLKTLEGKMSKAFSEKKDDFTELGFELKNLETKIKLYENSQCPTCGSNLHTDEHHTASENTKSERDEKVITFNSLQEDLRINQTKIKTVSDKIQEMDAKIFKINLLTNQYKKEIEKAVIETKELDADYLQQLVEENQSKKIEKKAKHTETSIEDGFLETVEVVLGEEGVKNLAMKTILPSLNVNIANMSKQVHLPYSIKFNDRFDCIVNALGEEINPRSMSTGERKKADFIIIIALLKLLKVRYPSLNLLFLDEIFSSVDSSGVYEIIKILSDVSKENHLNTWVINHTELPTELFDKKVEAIREGGFSKLKVETIS